MFAQNMVLTVLGLSSLMACGWCYDSAGYNAAYQAVPYGDYASGYPTFNVGAAKSSAGKVSGVDWSALHQYGYQIGKPLLVKDYGKLIDLYSALAPKRSFVGSIDPGFYKDSYGKVKYYGETSVGVLAV